jgi:NAD+-dependent farnesol dehydrogenase
MSILLTGATGYLGSNIAKRLASEGRDLILYVRDPKKLPNLSGSGKIEWIKGDLRNAGALRQAVKQCDTLIHAAALVKVWAKKRREFYEVNVQAFRNLLDLAKEYSVKRFIYTSSFMALGPSDGQVLTEHSLPRGHQSYNDYERTKSQAHRIALQATQDGFPIVTVYPGVIYGPGPSTEGNLVGNLILKFMQGKLPGLIGNLERKWAFSYVDDVAAGHCQALERGVPGGRYILAGENRSLQDFLFQLSALTGKQRPKLVIPYWAGWLLGHFDTLKASVTGVPPQITAEVVKIYRHDWSYSSQRAIQELGYKITPFEEGLKRTVEYYQNLLTRRAL